MKFKNAVFPVYKVFKWTTERKFLKGKKLHAGNVKIKFIFWIHFCILFPSTYCIIFQL